MRQTVLLLLFLATAAGCKTPMLAGPDCTPAAGGTHDCRGNEGIAHRADRPEADVLLRRAEQEVRLALQTGFIWSETEARLAEAKAARAAGDLDTASRLARVAIDEAVQAQLQARAATKVKRDFTYRP
jgi:hypothetical protein